MLTLHLAEVVKLKRNFYAPKTSRISLASGEKWKQLTAFTSNWWMRHQGVLTSLDNFSTFFFFPTLFLLLISVSANVSEGLLSYKANFTPHRFCIMRQFVCRRHSQRQRAAPSYYTVLQNHLKKFHFLNKKRFQWKFCIYGFLVIFWPFFKISSGNTLFSIQSIKNYQNSCTYLLASLAII